MLSNTLTTPLLLLSASLALTTPLHPRQDDAAEYPYALNCDDSAALSIWCGQNGVPACSGPEHPDTNSIPVACASCECSQFPPMDDLHSGSGFVPPSAALPANAVAPDGEDCKSWNERLAANGAMRAEGYQVVKPCN